MVPGAETGVVVRRFEAPHHLGFEWTGGMQVEMRFEAIDGAATHLTVGVSGFAGEGMLEQVVNTIEGFSIVLCDLKTLLETGTSAGLVRDKAALITRNLGAHR